jgi:hypothetical protein
MLQMDGQSSVHESFGILSNLERIMTLGKIENEDDEPSERELNFVTEDKKFVLKAISKSLFTFFKSNFEQFYKHHTEHPNSLLAKIYALLTIRSGQIQRPIYLILVKNLEGLTSAKMVSKYYLDGLKRSSSVKLEGAVSKE